LFRIGVRFEPFVDGVWPGRSVCDLRIPLGLPPRWHTANITCHIARKRGTVDTDRPGREVSQEHREVIVYLIDSQGWSYRLPRGGGYPTLFPADRSQSPIQVPKTGHSRGHAFRNWIAEIRRKGGHWPPDRK
jgi:hypothetical protein